MSLKFVCLILAVLIQLAASNPPSKSNYIEQEKSCRDVCSLCSCEGFYCEDECICECQIADEDNLQCIADMKKECDKNGLEYEILTQDENGRDRFSRQIDVQTFADLSKNFAIMKSKREPQTVKQTKTETVVEETKSEDPTVAAPAPEAEKEEPKEDIVGFPIAAAKASKAGALAFAGLGKLEANKLMFALSNLKERFPSPPPPPAFPALPKLPSLRVAAPAPVHTTTAAPSISHKKSSSKSHLILQPLNLF